MPKHSSDDEDGVKAEHSDKKEKKDKKDKGVSLLLCIFI